MNRIALRDQQESQQQHRWRPMQSVLFMMKLLFNLSQDKASIQQQRQRFSQIKAAQKATIINPKSVLHLHMHTRNQVANLIEIGKHLSDSTIWTSIQSGQRQQKLARIPGGLAITEPRSFQEAREHPLYGKQWGEVINAEYNALVKNSTWIFFEELPAGRKPCPASGYSSTSSMQIEMFTRFKTRLIARGFTQVYGVDHLDAYAPIAKMASLQILFAIAAAEDLEIHQMNVVTAFLLGDLEEEPYMEQPEGFVKYSKGKKMYCKVRDFTDSNSL